MNRWSRQVIWIIILGSLSLVLAPLLEAARLGESSEIQWQAQVVRYFRMADPTIRIAAIGSLLLGLNCGLLGTFIVVRRMALMGDTLSHAVLPGVALGFMWNFTKDPLAIFTGATVAGLLGVVLVSLIRKTTHLKEDVAMGMVLAGFYGLGICLMTFIQGQNTGNFAGLDKFLFGQAAALSEGDIRLMVIVTLLTVTTLILFYKELLVFSFDRSFARVLGIPIEWVDFVFMLLLAFAIVISLQAVGVVLVSAMLIIPAATAYLLTGRLFRMILIAGGIGMLGGFTGAFFSFLGNNLPTGPFMVLTSAFIFTLAYVFAPGKGVLYRWQLLRRRRSVAETENLLKYIYRVLEAGDFSKAEFRVSDLVDCLNEPLETVMKRCERLVKEGHLVWESGNAGLEEQEYLLRLTSSGMRLATSVVRRHRLWEVYLTESARYAEDHVHDDAERVEHVLSEATLARLEERLGYPHEDPHGRKIPEAPSREVTTE